MNPTLADLLQFFTVAELQAMLHYTRKAGWMRDDHLIGQRGAIAKLEAALAELPPEEKR